MPAAQKSTRRTAPRKRTTARKRTNSSSKLAARKRTNSSSEPAALKRLNKALDTAQDALVALRKDVGGGVGRGTRDIHKNLQKMVREARRDGGRLGKTLQREADQLQKRVKSSPSKPPPAKKAGRAGARRKTTARSTPKRGRARGGTRTRAR